MDVLDPSYVPAVPNPEPEGLNTATLLDLLEVVCDRRVVGFDVVEVAPQYDQGVTAIQATKVLFELLGFLERAKKAKYLTFMRFLSLVSLRRSRCIHEYEDRASGIWWAVPLVPAIRFWVSILLG